MRSGTRFGATTNAGALSTCPNFIPELLNASVTIDVLNSEIVHVLL